jgi:SecD/SecF fusion protein
MLENARRQVTVVLLAMLAAIYLLVRHDFNWGLDLQGGTQLIYNIPIEENQRLGLLPKDANPEQIMAETLRIFDDRVDPHGTTEATITRRGDRDVMIELPHVTAAEAQAIQRRVETLGRLEMRVLADGDYNEGGVKFDLTKEQEKLTKWLDADGGKNRELLRGDPHLIRLFNTLGADDGGPDPNVRWYPGIIKPSDRDAGAWDHSYSQAGRNNVVALFTPEEWSAGPKSPEQALWELFPINMHEQSFQGEDMDASGVAPGNDPRTGLPCVYYALAGEKRAQYADWSDKYKNKPSAIILNGVVRSAPTFQGRIPGSGVITGGFTVREADELAKVIKTGSLQVRPVRKSMLTIGATLGADSVNRGLISMAIGSGLVLLFMLAYYRLSGLVACTALALNVLLMLGILLFVRATLTLPGLAGVVLTVGMAVDANILIYERIREEMRKGKELLQAVRMGFDRAMITILDANITTFLVGVVLYNVGVGPVRGFAVTLMIGIVTTVFTAFFVSRLVFHYLLATKTLKTYRVAEWFQTLGFDFLRLARPAFALSIVVIAAGFVYYGARVPWDRAFGLDFTGGANLQIVLQQPQTKAELRETLLADSDFRTDFPDPIVNTAGQVDGNRATSFIIKLKLTDRLRAQLETEKEQAGPDYVPRYEQQLRRILADRLVRGGFTNPVLVPDDTNQSMMLAGIEVHFAEPVDRAAFETRMKAAYGQATVSLLEPESNMPAARDFYVSFPVDAATPLALLGDRISDAIQERPTTDERKGQDALLDTTGQPAALSEPIPQSETIGGRMVDELRNAAIGAILLSLFLIVMYIRLRFHEYKYGIGAVVALIHDVLVTFVVVVAANHLGLVNAEIDLAMIAAFLTIIGYSINDTIVIFDRVRENLHEQQRLGDTHETLGNILNRSINQTLSRTILTTGATLLVVIAQFVVNYGAGTSLEGFSFALIVGMVSGTYSTIYIASPVVLWIRNREAKGKAGGGVLGKELAKGSEPLQPTA